MAGIIVIITFNILDTKMRGFKAYAFKDGLSVGGSSQHVPKEGEDPNKCFIKDEVALLENLANYLKGLWLTEKDVKYYTPDAAYDWRDHALKVRGGHSKYLHKIIKDPQCLSRITSHEVETPLGKMTYGLTRLP